MNIGDTFYTIAYSDIKVIEVEIIDIENIDGIEYIHFQNVEHNRDKWFKSIEYVELWKFKTKEEAECIISEIRNVKK